MGWSTGSSLMADIIAEIEETDLKHDMKVEIYKILIDKFQEYDCDTLDECFEDSAAFQEAFMDMEPEIASELLDLTGDEDYLED